MTVPRSNIGWTDYSGGPANFVLRGRAAGDCEVSPGCAHCYAAPILRRSGQTPEHTTIFPAKLAQLARARFEPGDTPYRRGPDSRPMVFVIDMGDLFHEAVPDAFIEEALYVMRQRQDVDWQVLTKRAERMAGFASLWPWNVWAGVSAENQAAFDERVPWLLKMRGITRFVSLEPLLAPLSILPQPEMGNYDTPRLHWVIVGGESGPKRRPFDVAWARSLRDQCIDARISFHYKQGSNLRPGQDDRLDGVMYKQFPRRAK